VLKVLYHGQVEQRRTQTASLPYYVQPLALGTTVFLIAVQVWTWIFYLPLFIGGRADFRHLYSAGLMIRTGHAHELYDQVSQQFFQSTYVSPGDFPIWYNHMAYEALFYVPFSVFKYRASYLIFLAFNLALLVVLYRRLHPRMRNIVTVYPWLFAGLIAAFLPIGVALIQGQDSIILLFLLAGALLAIERNREILAGALIALGLFKFTVVLPIALLFFAWRRWKFTAGFVVFAAFLLAISIGLVGLNGAQKYIALLRAMGTQLSTSTDQALYGIRITAMPNLRGLVYGFGNQRLSLAEMQLITVLISVAILIWAAIAGAKLVASDRFLFAITASAVVSYHFLLHDMSILFLPIIAALDRYLRSGSPAGRSAALLFIAPLCWSFAPSHFYLVCLPLCVFLAFASRKDKVLTVHRTPTFNTPVTVSESASSPNN
jgi:Glycosyltransferase family 87